MFSIFKPWKNMCIRVCSVWIPHLATPAKKKRFLVNKCDRGVQHPPSQYEIEISKWDCPAKNIYKSRHVFFFEIATTLSPFGTCQTEISCDKFHMWNSHQMHSKSSNSWKWTWDFEAEKYRDPKRKSKVRLISLSKNLVIDDYWNKMWTEGIYHQIMRL